ncbi:MAG: M28 family peptidase [Saprospiraceae bacterium]|nr:M28 family peptidase [Saprospiraceae bacterium]
MRLVNSFILSLVVFVMACHADEKNSDTTSENTNQVVKNYPIPKFDRDSAFAFVAAQVAFGPRVPNTPAHQQGKIWIVNQLQAFGAEVIEQNFEAKAYTGTMLKGTNIIGQYNPQSSKRIILAAHWDTRHVSDHDPDPSKHTQPVLGADDGASGVGILLEIARQLNQNPTDLGIDIIFFDLEDYGDGGDNGDYTSWCLGSQYWAKNLHRTGYKADYGILLDMVGASGARFTKEQLSMQFAPQVMNKVWQLAQSMGYGNFFVNESTRELIDDHLFVNQIAKIPMIDIINRPIDTETLFVRHWHTTEDTLDKIDPRTLRAVGQVLLAVIYREASGTI